MATPTTEVQVTPSSNPYLNALQWGGWRWDDGADDGPDLFGTTIYYYLRPDVLDFNDDSVWNSNDTLGFSRPWADFEAQAYALAAAQWEAVANIDFVQVFAYGDADLVEHIYVPDGKPDFSGLHETPEQAFYTDHTAWSLYTDSAEKGWSAEGLQIGGRGFMVLVHELGHALGLAHPHDDGGGSGQFPGVHNYRQLGDHDLNQGVYTVMSYNAGWQGPYGTTPDLSYGYEAGPMAFDIAAIQYLYGANMNTATGNDSYVLPDVNAPGTYYHCIWDAGGTDQIAYFGELNVTIDLRAATLDNSPLGGGALSYANGIFGGFTIANGVTIENAIGGLGDDQITGNELSNVLTGGGGDDTFAFQFNAEATQTLVFRNGITPNGAANEDAWAAFSAALAEWYTDLTTAFGLDFDPDLTTVAGIGRGRSDHSFDNHFTVLGFIDGPGGDDRVADFEAGDHLLFQGITREEIVSLNESGLFTVTPSGVDTLIHWDDGSIVLSDELLSFDQLLSDYIVFA